MIDKLGLELLIAHGLFQTANGALNVNVVLLSVGGFNGHVNRCFVNASVHDQIHFVAHANHKRRAHDIVSVFVFACAAINEGYSA